MPRLAFYTFAHLLKPEGHPEVAGFFARNPANFAAAEASEGFIARSGYEIEPDREIWGAVVYPRYNVATGDDEIAATLSLWEDLESVFAFAYNGVHAKALKRRHKWFQKVAWPTYAAWWVADDHVPDWQEAATRHEHLHDHGASDLVFDFSMPFGPDGAPVTLNRALVKTKMERNA